MGNKMDNLKHIDGYVEDQASVPLREFPHKSHLNIRNHRDGVEPSQVRSTTPPPPVSPPTTKSAKIQALTLKQLSAGLSVTTERAERRQEGVTRDYTVFDMADAVTVTHPPSLQEERLDNHRPGGGESDGQKAQQGQRPHFKTYSETAPLRISTQEAGGKFVVIIVLFSVFSNLKHSRTGGLQHPPAGLHRVRPESLPGQQSRGEASGGPGLLAQTRGGQTEEKCLH